MEDEKICDVGQSGMVFPIFGDDEHRWSHPLRGFLYGMGLVYFFLGVAIVADVFMASIEVVTSRRAKKTRSDGRSVTVKVWNETVATLTLMALGSSAPEIFLSLIDLVKKRFHFGALGPATIVGSASFNLLIIVAVCVVVIPSSEVRVVKNLPAFYITAFFSILAYIWMGLILVQITPQVVDLWEAVVTFLMLPALIAVSYKVDRGDANGLLRKLNIIDPEVEAVEEESNPSYISFTCQNAYVPASQEPQTLEVTIMRRGHTEGEVSLCWGVESMTAVPGYDYEVVEGEIIFDEGQASTIIEIPVLPRDQWKNACVFLVVLSDINGYAGFDPEDDGGEDEAILTVTIDAFPTNGKRDWYRRLDWLVNIDALKRSAAEWHGQWSNSIYCNGSPEEQLEATKLEWFSHLASLPWKLIFCFMPPTCLGGGWFCFYGSLLGIAMLTACVSDLAELFGCVMEIPDIVTAISFVALGTSMPDLFASLSAAKEDPTADASIVNVTGSNSVNVFLGLGVPWTFAAIHWKLNGPDAKWLSKYERYIDEVGVGNAAFIVEAENLGFSVVLFCYLCILALVLLHLRRKWIGCELGGPRTSKISVFATLTAYWLGFVALVSWWSLRVDHSFSEEFLTLLISFLLSIAATIVPLVIMKMQHLADKREHVDRRSASVHSPGSISPQPSDFNPKDTSKSQDPPVSIAFEGSTPSFAPATTPAFGALSVNSDAGDGKRSDSDIAPDTGNGIPSGIGNGNGDRVLAPGTKEPWPDDGFDTTAAVEKVVEAVRVVGKLEPVSRDRSGSIPVMNSPKTSQRPSGITFASCSPCAV